MYIICIYYIILYFNLFMSLTLSKAGIGAGDVYPWNVRIVIASARLMKLESVMVASCCQCLVKCARSTALRVKTMQLKHVEPTRTALSLARRFPRGVHEEGTEFYSQNYQIRKSVAILEMAPWVSIRAWLPPRPFHADHGFCGHPQTSYLSIRFNTP